MVGDVCGAGILVGFGFLVTTIGTRVVVSGSVTVEVDVVVVVLVVVDRVVVVRVVVGFLGVVVSEDGFGIGTVVAADVC